MTKSEAYEYLARPRRLQHRIYRLTMQRDEYQAMLLPSAIRYDKDVVQTSPEDKQLELAAAVLDLDAEIRRLTAERARVLLDICDRIGRLPDDTEVAVLVGYFIRRRPMSEIADTLGYSTSHCYYCCRRGVKHFAELPDVT